MTDSECIILAFGTLRKTTDAVLSPVLTERLTTTSYDLMGICLMTDIVDELILRSIIDIMQTHDEFDCSEARSQMTWIHRAALHHILADFSTESPQSVNIEFLDVLRGIYSAKYLILNVFHHSAVTDLRRYKKNATFAKISVLTIN